METLNQFLQTLFASELWLPSPLTWNDMSTSFDDLLYIAFPLVLAVTLVRIVLSKFIYTPLSKQMLPEYRKLVDKPKLNKELQEFYQVTPSPFPEQLEELARSTKMSLQDVGEWFETMRQHEKTHAAAYESTLKFVESCVKLTHHTSMFVSTVWILLDKVYLYDVKLCWEGYPQPIQDDEKFIYMLHLGIYIHFVFSHFFDNHRSDFWEMFIHHCVTVWLLTFSYVCNFYRVGLLISAIHDVSDIFLQTAKIAHYCLYNRVTDIMFGTFAVSFFISRLMIYPYYLVSTVITDLPGMLGWFLACRFFAGALLILVGLHIFWMYLILAMIYRIIKAGKIEGDIRSSGPDT